MPISRNARLFKQFAETLSSGIQRAMYHGHDCTDGYCLRYDLHEGDTAPQESVEPESVLWLFDKDDKDNIHFEFLLYPNKIKFINRRQAILGEGEVVEETVSYMVASIAMAELLTHPRFPN